MYKMKLFFCLDIANQESGILILTKLLENANSFDWDFRVKEQFKNPNDQKSELNNNYWTTNVDNFVKIKWKREDSGLFTRTVFGKNFDSYLQINFPERGGSILKLTPDGNLYFTFGSIDITYNSSEIAIHNEVLSFLISASTIVNGAFGYITLQDSLYRRPMEYPICENMRDVYGVTFIGNRVAGLIGRDRIMSSPSLVVAPVGAGIVMQLKAELDESLNFPNIMDRDDIINHLGIEWFSRREPNSFLNVSDLVIPSEIKSLLNY